MLALSEIVQEPCGSGVPSHLLYEVRHFPQQREKDLPHLQKEAGRNHEQRLKNHKAEETTV